MTKLADTLAVKAALALIATAALLTPGQLLALPALNCQRIELPKGEIEWVSSMSASANGFQVVDVRAGHVLNFKMDGTKAGENDYGGRPVRVFSGAESSMVRLQGSEAVVIKDGKASKRLDFALAQEGSGAAVGSVYDAVLLDDVMIGYGSVWFGPRNLGEAPDFQLGLFRVGLDTAPWGAELKHRLQENKYYLLGYQYLAATRSEVYFLEMSRPIKLYKLGVEGDASEIAVTLPKGFTSAPQIQAPTDRIDAVAELYHEVEGYEIPNAIFAIGSRLFFLLRDSGGWYVYEMPRTDGSVGKKMRLDTDAHHLTVAVSEDGVVFLERGVVEAWGQQEVNSALICPLRSFGPMKED